MDIGVRLVLSVSDGEIRAAVLLPNVGAGSVLRAGVGSIWFGRTGVEILRVALRPADVVRWAVPVVSILAEVSSAGEGTPLSEREPARPEGL
jgi:hypothetical protein